MTVEASSRKPPSQPGVLAFIACAVLAASGGWLVQSLAASAQAAHQLEELGRIRASAEEILEHTLFCAAPTQDAARKSCERAPPALERIEDFLGQGHPGVASVRDGLTSLSGRNASSPSAGAGPDAGLSAALAVASATQALQQDVVALVETRSGEILARETRLVRFGVGFVSLATIAFALVALAFYGREAARTRRLLAAEERYRKFASVFADEIWEFDRDGNLLTARSDQPDAAADLGLTDGAAEAFREFLSARRPFNSLERRSRTEGGERIHALTGKPIFDADGAYEGYLVAAQDVTFRRRIEVDQLRSDQRLASIVNFLPLALFRAEGSIDDPRYTFVSASAGRIVGITREKLLGASFFGGDAEIAWEDRARFEADLRRGLADGGLGVACTRLRQADGGMRWIKLIARQTAWAPEGGVAIEGLWLDVTDEFNRQRLIEDLEQALNILGRAICIGDRETLTVAYGNACYWQFFGKPEPGAEARLLRAQQDAYRLPEERLAEIVDSIDSDGGWTGEFDMTGEDGRPRHLYGTVRALDDRRFAMVMSDLTERERQIRAELRLQRQLSDAERLGAIGSLAGGVAHDFNNIVGAIRGFADLLVADLDKGSDLHRYADRIVAACRRAAALVKEVMAYSQIHSVKHEAMFTDEATAGVADILLSRSEKGIVFKLANGARRCVIEGSTTQLSQVLSNLVLNAADASPSGSVVALNVTRAEPDQGLLDEFHAAGSQRVGVARDGSHIVWQGALAPGRPYVLFSVSDRGSGMTRQVLERMFEPFFSTKGAGRGTGLGLAIAAAVVAAHCGAIRVRSKLGAGTTFEIFVPVVAERDRQDCAALPLIGDTEATRGTERILVVDDEVDIAEAIATALQRLGYEAAPVDDPKEALSLFAEDPCAWDVVISDYSMPGMDGLLLLRKMRGLNPAIKTIICTGYANSLREDTAAKYGLNAFFTKPTGADALAKAVRSFFAPAGAANATLPT